jgi:FtsP/CotA-like multicopper oxidase with cupredoxin domain
MLTALGRFAVRHRRLLLVSWSVLFVVGITVGGAVFAHLKESHGASSVESVRVGELQVWDILNDTKMDHPFHLHGFFFQVLERDGAGTVPPSWEDTVTVPAKSRIRFAWLPDDRPGNWMYHCHILEHHAAGMMAHFDVIK